MPRRLVALNAVLVAVAFLSAAYMYRELRRAPSPVPPPRRAAPAALAAAPSGAETQPGGYAVVTSRNLFSPTRSEAPAAGVSNASQPPKPNLFGIVLRDGVPVAYLEDPTTKRVAGYRLGDSVAGGTVAQIGADHVVLNRPGGDVVNVRLRDPSKPRPAAAQTGLPATAGAPQAGQVPPVMSAPTPITAPPQPVPPAVLPRRPLPPNLLRRLPPPAASDASAQN